jgi:hypothetical protein
MLVQHVLSCAPEASLCLQSVLRPGLGLLLFVSRLHMRVLQRIRHMRWGEGEMTACLFPFVPSVSTWSVELGLTPYDTGWHELA